MGIDYDKMAARIAAVVRESIAAEDKPADKPADKVDEKKAADEKPAEKAEDKGDKKEASERELLAAEITALEQRLNVADVKPSTASDDKDEDDKKDEAKKASLVDPSGVEEKITQKRFTEVEDLEHGTELSEGLPLDVAPTGYVAKMKSASSRLDAVASYLEKTGRTAMAMRIDKIADAIDTRVAAIEQK